MADQPHAVEVRKVLERNLHWRCDRQLSLKTIHIGMLMTGILGQPGHHTAVLDMLRSLPPDIRRKLNVVLDGRNETSYRMIESAVADITRVLADPEVLVEHDHPVADADTGEMFPCPPACPFIAADATWYITAMALAAIPADIPRARSMALDATDMPTWAKHLFRFPCDAETAPGDLPDYHAEAMCAEREKAAKGQKSADGDAEAEGTTDEEGVTGDDGPTDAETAADAETVAKAEGSVDGETADDAEDSSAAKGGKGATTDKAPIGPDGRLVPSKDPDARKSHRSPRTNMSEFFIGYFLHTYLGVREIDGKPVAPFTFGAEVAPAGAYPARSAMAVLRVLRHFGVEVNDLLADRGYTALDPDNFSRPVREIADNIVMDMVEHQRKRQPDFVNIKDKGKLTERTIRVMSIAGSYFASSLPRKFHDLARPNRNAEWEEVQRSMAEFDKRGEYAFVRHGTTPAGTPRWAGPATSYAGYKVRCRNNPMSFRDKALPGVPDIRPITTCVEGKACSCGEVVTIADRSTEREQQDEIWGGTRWTKSFNRRTVVERGYADDKYHVGNMSRESIRCFGRIKHAIYYAPIAAARNIAVSLRWYHLQDQPDPWNLHEVNLPRYEEPAKPQRMVTEATGADGSAAPAAASTPVPAPFDLESFLAEQAGAAIPTRNRKQRRAAARKAASGRKGTSKPPKPPPKSEPTADDR